jgi:hypothetical protein
MSDFIIKNIVPRPCSDKVKMCINGISMMICGLHVITYDLTTNVISCICSKRKHHYFSPHSYYQFLEKRVLDSFYIDDTDKD